MKKLILTTIICMCVACGGNHKHKPTVNVTDDEITPEITIDTEESIKILVFSDNDIVKWYSGTEVSTFKSGKSCFGTGRIISVNSTHYELDEKGNIITTDTLLCVPDILDGDFYIRNIPASEALAAGCLNKIYTAIYYNGAEYGDWKTRQYQTVKSNNLIIKKSTGAFVGIENEYNNINYANDEIVIHDFDATVRTAKINGVSVSWSTNFMNSANEWIYFDGKYYSWNGYIFDGVTLTENVSAMTIWRSNTSTMTGYTEQAVIKFCGVYLNEIYFIECNSGILFKYNPANNIITEMIELYDGDGIRANGLIYREILQPCMNNTYMFFRFGNSLYRLRWDNMLVAYLTPCNGRVKIWD